VLALAFCPGLPLIECFATEQSLQYLRIFDCVVKQILASEEAPRAIAPQLPDAMTLAGGARTHAGNAILPGDREAHLQVHHVCRIW
jgi:hypothetical protein